MSCFLLNPVYPAAVSLFPVVISSVILIFSSIIVNWRNTPRPPRAIFDDDVFQQRIARIKFISDCYNHVVFMIRHWIRVAGKLSLVAERL